MKALRNPDCGWGLFYEVQEEEELAKEHSVVHTYFDWQIMFDFSLLLIFFPTMQLI